MTRPAPHDRIRHVLDSVDAVRRYVSLPDADQDMLRVAVLRRLEIIGEAVGAPPDDVKQRAPQVPWKEIVGFRNRLVHEYFRIDADIVEQVIRDDLDPLTAALTAELER